MDSPQVGRPRESFDRALESAIDSSFDRYVGLLERTLRIPSPRMQEHEVVRFLSNTLKQAGCHVKIFEGDGEGEPAPAGRPINLFAVRNGRGGGKSLILGAHLDSVPPGDLKKWKHGPWSGDIEDGRIYGRGAHDDRSGGAIICMVVDLLNQLRLQTLGDIYILATTEEEYSCGGMRAYARSSDRVHADAYLEVDGNGINEAVTGLAGALSFQLRIEGPYGTTQNAKHVHDSNPIELMADLIRELRGFERKVPSEPGWTNSIVAVTEIRSRGWFSNVPEECIATGFANVIPPLTVQRYKTDFESVVRKTATRSPWLRAHPPTVSWGPLDLPALIVPDNSDFVRTLNSAHAKGFGTPLRARKLGGWCDAQILGIPNTVLYGPGAGGGDHSYDEYYDLKTLRPMLKTLATLVVEWCKRTPGTAV